MNRGMPAASIAALVARELSLPEAPVARALQLLEGGATVPFIARYRKEATSGLDDGALQRLSDHAKIVAAREARRGTTPAQGRAPGAPSPAPGGARGGVRSGRGRRVRAAATCAGLGGFCRRFKRRRRTRAHAGWE